MFKPLKILDEKNKILRQHSKEVKLPLSKEDKETIEHIIKHFLDKKKVQIVPINIEDFSDIPILPVSIPGTLCVRPTNLYEGFFVAKLVKI